MHIVKVVIGADDYAELILHLTDAEWNGVKKLRDAYRKGEFTYRSGKYIANFDASSDIEDAKRLAEEENRKRKEEEEQHKKHGAFAIAYKKAMAEKNRGGH